MFDTFCNSMCRRLISRHVQVMFSQEGEDAVLRRLFEPLSRQNGFYVDIGAHHPQRFSNTYHFYRNGWRGINVEPNNRIQNQFTRKRPRDINLCCGVGAEKSRQKYFMFNEAALNTFDPDIASERQKMTYVKLIDTIEVDILSLSSILADNLPQNTSIDFLTIDVEGYDLQVLISNDWSRFRPLVVLAEDRGSKTIQDGIHSPTAAFMEKNGYLFASKTVNTMFFVEKNSGLLR